MKKNKGVTLIELLIAVAIMGILASVAYPSYVDFVIRSNRAEAQRELSRLANLQEQYFIDHRTYTADMTKLGMSADPYITESKNYSIDATATTTTFDLVATAQGAQSGDSICATLAIDEVGKKTATSTSTCWEK